MTERQFQEELWAALRRQGWTVDLEYKVPGGRIDILARKRHRTRIIETKLGVNRWNVKKLMAQLDRYSAAIPEATLWFAAPYVCDRTVKQLTVSGYKHLRTRKEDGLLQLV